MSKNLFFGLSCRISTVPKIVLANTTEELFKGRGGGGGKEKKRGRAGGGAARGKKKNADRLYPL